MLKLFKFLRWQEWIQIFLCLLLTIFHVWVDLKIPEYMSKITVLVQTEGSKMSDIWINGGYMLLCAFGSLATAILVGFFASRISALLSFRVRKGVYDSVGAFSMEEINKFSTSSLITRSTNDITQVQMFVAMGLQVLIKAPILAIWAIVKIVDKSWEWSVATAIAVAILVLLLSVIIIFALPRFKVIQKLTDNLNRVTRENLTGVRVVRAYNAESYQEEKFEQVNKSITKNTLITNRIMAMMMPGMTLIMSGLSLAIYWIGAYLINNAVGYEKVAKFSEMVVYSSYAIQVVLSFMLLIFIFILLPRASVSAKRINEVLNTKTKIHDGNLTNVRRGRGEVEFKNVCFKYPGANDYVLKNITFKVSKGETVAFIGSTGSGKSTLINLIPRFYDATEGKVLIDGKNIKDYSQKDLHSKIGYVSQKAVIFSGSVFSNVAFGDNGKEKSDIRDVKRALEIAQAKKFVEDKPNSYDFEVAQGGTNLSGGQKQRLSIARAICRNPEIFIFDDSFSALDYKTDKELRKDLSKQTKGATTFIVAQRIGTIMNADKIIVLDKGEIVGMGKHKELLKNCDVYKEIALSQLSEEELK